MTVAWRLFTTQGYDETTIEHIADAAGMSKRSFFRYFGSKEDLVLLNLDQTGRALADALARRPTDEPAWTALRRAFDDLVAAAEADPEWSQPLLRMIGQAPALRASQLEKQQRWRAMLAPLIAVRLPDRATDPNTPDPRPVAITGAALACLEAAQSAWLAAPGSTLTTQLDDAMAAVCPIGV